MMKRPRSFISTLVVALLVMCAFSAAVPYPAHAGALPRVLDPRAGDPTQPGDGFLPDNSTAPSSEPDVIRAGNTRGTLSRSSWYVLNYELVFLQMAGFIRL